MVVIGSSGVLAPGSWRWLRALAWMAALCAALVVGFNAAARGTLLALGPAAADGAGAKLAAAVAGSIAIIAIYWLAVRFGERRPAGELRLRYALPDLALGIIIGAAIASAIIAAQWAFGWVAIDARPIDGIALALRDSIRSGVLEEVVLRLVIFRLLWRSFGIWPAIALAALLFGALHLGNPESSLFAASCLTAGEGIGIGLYLLTGRIWASIGMHAAWNFTQGWIFGAAVSGTAGIAGGPLSLRPVAGVPDWLSGGGFGPEESLAAMVLSLAASAGFLFRAWQLGSFRAADDRADGTEPSS